jgi:hypothetical protein
MLAASDQRALRTLQNADDAKATSIRFCLDHRSHATGMDRTTPLT